MVEAMNIFEKWLHNYKKMSGGKKKKNYLIYH